MLALGALPGSAATNSATQPSFAHTLHPDALWFPDAGLGLFIHWDISSVKAMNISWSMIPGRPLGKQRVADAVERDRIIRESDYNLDGKPPHITPNEYWEMAKDFRPENYDPNKWLKAARDAGFAYAVFTTRHHSGFALWPSAFGGFNTTNFMDGRDLVKDYVEACRRNGLKVGLYYSPPDWHFDRDYFDFLYPGAHKLNPEFPALDADLKPRNNTHIPAELAAHQKEYAALVKGQVEELLTRYGQIDLLWFDGKPAIRNPGQCITLQRIRELQPGIVVNPRLHSRGDFATFERKLTADRPVAGWAEFCNPWSSSWSHQNQPLKANGYVLGQLVTSRSLGINYLLGVGPMNTGEFSPALYKNLAALAAWMKTNARAVRAVTPLPPGESASVPATASADARYLFAHPQFKDDGTHEKDLLPPTTHAFTLQGAPKPAAIKLLADGLPLDYDWTDGTLTVQLPARQRTKLVDVVEVILSKAK
jgi:alpha-L-fucosidase